MSDHRGIQDLDPAERLATALNRIAVASERREAIAAAAAMATGPAPQGLAPQGQVPQGLEPQGQAPSAGVAADLDGLIARLRAVLDGMPPSGDDGPGTFRGDAGPELGGRE